MKGWKSLSHLFRRRSRKIKRKLIRLKRVIRLLRIMRRKSDKKH